MPETTEQPKGGFHVWEYISDELNARRWDKEELAKRMSVDEPEVALTIIEFLSLGDIRIELGETVAEMLGRAFGTSRELWLRLDRSWHASQKDQPIE